MAPMFTIIIPVFNVKDYLVKCLDSVANQTCGDWECICVDDGSTDGSGKILDEYVERVKSSSCEFEREGGVGEENGKTSAVHLHLFSPPFFRVIHQKNGGVSAARNAALGVATGEWIIFVDADDYLEVDFLEKLKHEIRTHVDISVLEHSARYIFKDGSSSIGTSMGERSPGGVFPGEEILADPWGRRFTDLTRVVWNKVFKRSIIEDAKLRFPVGVPIGEDVIFSSCYYAFVTRALLVPELVGYNRVFRDDSALFTINADKLLPMIDASSMFDNVWRVRRSEALSIRIVGFYVGLMFLGKEHGKEVRSRCVQALVESGFYNDVAIPFVMRYGTVKARVFAIAYRLVCFSTLREKLLKYL